MSVELIILGAGGNSISIVDAVEAQALAGDVSFRIAGFLDDIPENQGKRVLGYPVLGPIEHAAKYPNCLLVNGISSVGSFRKRKEIVARTAAMPERFASIVHPSAVVSARATVGRGCVILANSVICPESVLGDHVLILQGTTVNHHSRLANHVTLSAGITILGFVEVGEGAFVGGGSSVAPYVKIGAGALVGMGSVVIRDVVERSVAAGNPARELKDSKYRGSV